MRRWGCGTDSGCVVCGMEDESVFHALSDLVATLMWSELDLVGLLLFIHLHLMLNGLTRAVA